MAHSDGHSARAPVVRAARRSEIYSVNSVARVAICMKCALRVDYRVIKCE